MKLMTGAGSTWSPLSRRARALEVKVQTDPVLRQQAEQAMRTINCPQEDAVTNAARRGAWPEELAAHAAECSVCREIKQASQWMQAFAEPVSERNSHEEGLPDAAWVWRRAQWAREDERAETMDAVLQAASTAAFAGISGGFAVWIASNWQAIEAAAERFLLTSWPQLPVSLHGLASLAPLALLVAAAAFIYPLLELE